MWALTQHLLALQAKYTACVCVCMLRSLWVWVVVVSMWHSGCCCSHTHTLQVSLNKWWFLVETIITMVIVNIQDNTVMDSFCWLWKWVTGWLVRYDFTKGFLVFVHLVCHFQYLIVSSFSLYMLVCSSSCLALKDLLLWACHDWHCLCSTLAFMFIASKLGRKYTFAAFNHCLGVVAWPL